MNENGFCPHCNANLDGGEIYQTFLDQGYDEKTAKDYASSYDGTKWGRQKMIYDFDLDRTVGYECPDCGKTWSR